MLYDFPVLHVSYCGLDKRYKEAVSFVAKEGNNNNNNNNNNEYWSITVALLLLMEQLCAFVKMLIVSALEELFYFPSSSFFLFLDNRFSCYVFKASNPDKAYALALSISKAFYLACQILQEQQGNFPATPERDILFEPQRDDDTKVRLIIVEGWVRVELDIVNLHTRVCACVTYIFPVKSLLCKLQVSPARPVIPGSPLTYRIQTQSRPSEEPSEEVDTPTDVPGSPKGPKISLTRPSITSTTSSLSSGVDDDFLRLARSRSNPDILRSTLETEVVTHPSLDLVRQHADPISHGNTPVATPSGSTENLIVS